MQARAGPLVNGLDRHVAIAKGVGGSVGIAVIAAPVRRYAIGTERGGAACCSVIRKKRPDFDNLTHSTH